jgi:hypothetical protein
MISSFLALSRLSFGAIAVGSLVLIACQNTGFGTNPAALGALPKNAARLSPASAPTYTWQPYNISGADNTLVTGISSDNNNIRFVAATYPNAGSPYKSFIADVSGSITTGGPVDEPPSHKPPDVYLAIQQVTSAPAAAAIASRLLWSSRVGLSTIQRPDQSTSWWIQSKERMPVLKPICTEQAIRIFRWAITLQEMLIRVVPAWNTRLRNTAILADVVRHPAPSSSIFNFRPHSAR